MEGSGRRESWQDAAVENRVRIDGLERESERQRLRIHELAASVAGVALLAERIGVLTEELGALGERFERLSKRAMERPTSSTWANLWQFAAVVIAAFALYVALRP